MIADLLGPIAAIGKKRAESHGHVLSWDIAEQSEVDPWGFAHLHPGGGLGRTALLSCLHETDDIRTGGEWWMGFGRRICTRTAVDGFCFRHCNGDERRPVT